MTIKILNLIGFLLITSSIFPAQAQDPSDPRSTLTKKYEEEKSLLSELKGLDQSLGLLHSELKNLNSQKEDIAIEQIRQQQQLKTIGEQYSQIEDTLIEKTKLLYKIHRRGIARIIFGAESPIDLRRRSTYLQILIDSDKSKLDEIRRLAKERTSVLDGLERNQNQLDILERNLSQKKEALSSEKQKKQTFLTEIQQEKSLALQLLRERQKAQQEFSNIVDNTRTAPTNGSRSTNFSDTYGKLDWPVQGTLLRRFGKQTDPISGSSIQSNGVDIQVPRGTSVSAVYDGVVALAKFIDTYGQTVVVNHGRYSTVYAHLSGINVKQGQRVSKGTSIGLVGNSGITDTQNTNWLSFEIRYNKSPQDPLRWLK